jgi:hypothetical protein
MEITMFHGRFITRVVTALALAIALEAIGLSAGAAGALNGSAKAPRVPASGNAVALTLSLAPALVVGGNQTTATITLSTPAPANGAEITLRSRNSAVAQFGRAFQAIGTSQLTIPKDSVSAAFPVRTFGVVSRTDVTLEAIAGADTAQATLTVAPASVKTLTIAPSKVVGGTGATASVTLDGLAPANAGVVVQVSIVREAASRTAGTVTTDTSIPSSVTIAPGATSATFSINTQPVTVDATVHISARTSDGSVREAASRDGTSNTLIFGESAGPTAALTISAPVASRLQLNPGSVSGGSGLIGTVLLTGKAPAGGVAVSLSASSSDATVPPSISVPAGSDRTDFKITTQNATSVRSVTINAVVARNNLTQLSSTNNLKQIAVAVNNVSDGTSNTITVGESAASGVTANLTITPTPPPFTIAVQPLQVAGGDPIAITLTVQPTAAVSSTLNSVTLASDHQELLPLPASVPITGTVQFSSKPQTVVVNATTNSASADQTVTVTATGFSISASTTLLIKQSAVPTVSITATNDQASEEGPVSGIVTVTRTGPVTSALTLFYSVNDPGAPNNPHPATNGVDFEQLSGQVIIPAGASSATITVRPIDDSEQEPEERVFLQLLPRPQAYTIQPGSSQAVVRIKDHHKP